MSTSVLSDLSSPSVSSVCGACPPGPTPVLHVINGEHFSGAERVQDLLALRLPQFGFRVDFATLKTGKFADCRHSATPLHHVPMRGKWDRRCVGELTRLIRRHEYRAIHAHTPRSLLVAAGAARRLRLPLVYHVHSPAGRDSTHSWKNRLNAWVEERCLRRVDRMICVSSSLAKEMIRCGHPRERIDVVPNGVPANRTAKPREDFPATWTLGTMALFRPRKGLETLLDGLAELHRRGAPVRLRAVGPFETARYQQQILQRVAQLGLQPLIEWTGFQQDVEAQLAQMDLFVLPSLFGEGLPMVVLEAMASGLPVVASRVEGIPEAIRHDRDGLIFQPGEPQELADGVESLIADPDRWKRYSRNALERQRQKLSDHSMAAGVADVYRQLVSHVG